MQPSPATGVALSSPLQFGQVELCCEWDCIGQTTVWPKLGTNIAVLRRRLQFQTPCRPRPGVESRDNACAIGQHRCAVWRLADAFVAPSVRTGSPILRWPKDM